MPRSRPELLVLLTGTGTEVGKTWVACELARTLQDRGLRVAARKAVQSYDPADGRPTDAELLAAATHDDPKIVCPDTLSFPVPMAPPMAAEALDMNPPKLSEVVSRLAWPADADVGIVEAAGGVRSPLAIDGDTVDLCARLDPDVVVLVSDAELGAINGVRTAAACLGGRRLLVYLNRYLADEDVQLRNRQWLAERDGFRVLTDPLGLADAVWDR